MSDMQVYLLERDLDVVEYGQTEAAVVVALDPNDARQLMRESDKDTYAWFDPAEVTVTHLGSSADGQRGVILTSEAQSS